ncbi:unnamed protein product, partial [Brassica napus]
LSLVFRERKFSLGIPLTRFLSFRGTERDLYFIVKYVSISLIDFHLPFADLSIRFGDIFLVCFQSKSESVLQAYVCQTLLKQIKNPVLESLISLSRA